jgi:hypothetical protein
MVLAGEACRRTGIGWRRGRESGKKCALVSCCTQQNISRPKLGSSLRTWLGDRQKGGNLGAFSSWNQKYRICRIWTLVRVLLEILLLLEVPDSEAEYHKTLLPPMYR